MSDRRDDPDNWEQVLIDTAHQVAPWPRPGDTEPGAAVREALSGSARPIRRSRPRSEPSGGDSEQPDPFV